MLTLGALFGLLMLRAWIPTGFMPAPGKPFVLELCQAGLKASPRQEPGRHAAVTIADSCPFGHSPTSAPPPDVRIFAPPASIATLYAAPAPRSLQQRAPLAHRARAPPVSA